MSLPTGDPFEAFLSETRLVSTKPDGQYVVFDVRDESFSNAPVLYLSYPMMDLKIDSVLKRVGSALKRMGCAADTDIALAILGIIAETREPGSSSVEHANQCLSSVHSAQLHQWVVLPSKTLPGYRIKIGDICLKVFNPEKVLYWAKRGHCSYPVDLQQFTGQLALERTSIDTTLINLECLPGVTRLRNNWGERIATTNIINFYYQAVELHYFRQIASLVKDRLLLQEGGALIYFDIDNFVNCFQSNHIALFHWEGSVGHQSWALLSQRAFWSVNLPPAELLPKCDEWLKEELGFCGVLTSRPIDSSIKSYCQFLQRAQTHRLQGRADDAFLHFVIALDLLLGQEGRSSESVCLRAAVLVHRQLEASFDAEVKRLKRLYDRRCKYVHEGKQPTQQDLLDIEKICVEVLWVLLATSGACKFNDIYTWLKEVDFIASSLNTSREILDTDFQLLGIPPRRHKRIPPNRVKEQ